MLGLPGFIGVAAVWGAVYALSALLYSRGKLDRDRHRDVLVVLIGTGVEEEKRLILDRSQHLARAFGNHDSVQWTGGIQRIKSPDVDGQKDILSFLHL